MAASTANHLDMGEELEELSYDFTKYVPDCSGTIPEPSTLQIERFQRAVRSALAPALSAIEDAKDPVKRQAAIQHALSAPSDDDEKAAKKAHKDMLTSCAALCSNSPTVEQITGLPYRGQQIFVGWLVGKFLSSGESLAPATSN